jgi:hypothetical protein
MVERRPGDRVEIPGRSWSPPNVSKDRVYVTSAVSPGAFKAPSIGSPAPARRGNDSYDGPRASVSSGNIEGGFRCRVACSYARRPVDDEWSSLTLTPARSFPMLRVEDRQRPSGERT